VDRAAAALLAQCASRVIDQNAPHHLRRDCEEVSAVLPIDVSLIEQFHVRFVHDRRRLQPAMPPLAGELPRCERAQLAVDERNQPLERLAAAAAP
jgi:hypothetical protein